MPPSTDSPRDNPVLESSRREAIAAFVLLIVAMLYTVLYCYAFGYNRELSTLTYVLGFPDWIFWGVVAPWVVCVVISFLYGMVFMRDEDLGEDPAEGTAEFGAQESTHA